MLSNELWGYMWMITYEAPPWSSRERKRERHKDFREKAAYIMVKREKSVTAWNFT